MLSMRVGPKTIRENRFAGCDGAPSYQEFLCSGAQFVVQRTECWRRRWRLSALLTCRAAKVQRWIGGNLVVVEDSGFELVYRRQGEYGVAFVAASRASLVDGAATITGLQVQLRATIIAEAGTGRVEVVAEEALESGCRRHLGYVAY